MPHARSLIHVSPSPALAPLPPLQHNAAFALYGLSDNEDNLLEFVREGAVQRIHDCELVVQASRDCVNKLIKRLQVGGWGQGPGGHAGWWEAATACSGWGWLVAIFLQALQSHLFASSH